MTAARLVVAGLRHYWRTNLAVVLGVATAVAVLAGALLVGDSVRGSLRDLVLQRLGRTDRRSCRRGSSGRRSPTTCGRIAISPRRSVASARSSWSQGVVSDQASGRRVVARAGLRRGRSLLAVPASRRSQPAGRPRRVRQPRARRRHRRAPETAPSSSASSGRPRFRSSRCTAARTMSGRTLRLTVRAVLSRAGPRASSRCGRSRARCARSSCR